MRYLFPGRSVAFFILTACSIVALGGSQPSGLSTTTTTYSTTLGVTYDYLTSSAGSTFMAGYVTSTTALITTTITITPSSSSTAQSATSRTTNGANGSPPLAFYPESILVGLAAGLFLVFWIRSHKRN
jgi:hypothetical protein